MFGNTFWSTKLRPIIEYGSPLWSIDINDISVKKIENIQIKFFRELIRLSTRSCKRALLLDHSITDIRLRIKTEKEKFRVKCKLGYVPERIKTLYRERTNNLTYDGKITFNGSYKYGFPNVKKSRGRREPYITEIISKNQVNKKPVTMCGYSPKKLEKQRKKWINKNKNEWTIVIRPKETIFKNYRNTNLFCTSQILDDYEIDEIVQRNSGSKNKIWERIKCTITKKSIIRAQLNEWHENKQGKVLKRYKNEWYKDPVVNTIDNKYVHVVKKLRIGNSCLLTHRKMGNKKVVKCKICNKEETNEHFFLECKKYSGLRSGMIKKAKNITSKVGNSDIMRTLLGFYPKIYTSKKKTVKYKKQIIEMFDVVFQYMEKTKRFEKAKP